MTTSIDKIQMIKEKLKQKIYLKGPAYPKIWKTNKIILTPRNISSRTKKILSRNSKRDNESIKKKPNSDDWIIENILE